ncbi:MAG TPA: hypothetical protein VJ875_04905 [Pyrinomonadaceae bacterium]|nr:hypothetical protein [Pyrinomonadaceae bacterium]
MNSLHLLFLLALLVGPLIVTHSGRDVSIPTQVFDQYGAISWENEKARLDNFAIQLQNDDRLTGYILVFDAVGGCSGEAQARAIRAKRYVVEHRGVGWNRVIWRREGYLDGLTTVLQPVPRELSLPFPLLSTVAGSDAPLNRGCKARLQRIKSSRW